MRKQRNAERSEDRHRFAQIALGDVREFRDAGRYEEAFEAEDAGIAQRAQVVGIARHDAAPEADVHPAVSARGAALGFQRGAVVVVAGMLLSGMSIRVVVPPAAAARVAWRNLPNRVRPGSLMCTCVSTRPAMTTARPASCSGQPGGTDSQFSTAIIFPPRM